MIPVYWSTKGWYTFEINRITGGFFGNYFVNINLNLNFAPSYNPFLNVNIPSHTIITF